MLYGFFVATVILISYSLAKGYDFRKNRMNFVMVAFFLYALVLPRFLNYSFILLIIPTLHVIKNAMTSNVARTILVFFICVTFLPYQVFFVTIVLLFVHLRYIRLLLQPGLLKA